MRTSALVSVCALASVLSSPGSRAAEPAAKPAGMPLKIERVALFKNGLGYFTSSGILPAKAATVSLGQLPVPSFGTFWVGYDKDVKLRSLVTSMESDDSTAAVQSIGQLLQQNVGRKVAIRTGLKEDGVIEGTILKADCDAAPRNPPNPYFMDTRVGVDQYGRPLNAYYGGYPHPQANIVII